MRYILLTDKYTLIDMGVYVLINLVQNRNNLNLHSEGTLVSRELS